MNIALVRNVNNPFRIAFVAETNKRMQIVECTIARKMYNGNNKSVKQYAILYTIFKQARNMYNASIFVNPLSTTDVYMHTF